MITASRDSHQLPDKEYIKVFYTDDYTILEKRFSEMSAAKPFIERLKKNPDFHFIECRLVTERKYVV